MYGSVNYNFNDHPEWQPPLTVHTVPQTGTIYVGQASADQLLEFYDQYIALLSDTERAAGSRYTQQADRQLYVLQHGLLRALLGWYLGRPAAGIAFSFNSNKKPYLTANPDSCFFNISHSGPELLFAVGYREMGVDIEKIDHSFQYWDIAPYFSAAEVHFINQSPDPAAAFFLLWTRKEALLKACGTGIDDNLPKIPALDGWHQLPPDYNNTAWLTESFNARNNCMASITFPAGPKTNIYLSVINEEFAAGLLNKG